MPITNQPIIQDFFAAKRRSEIKIPSTQQLETWDTNKMTLFLKSHWADSDKLSLYYLQQKIVALLCLATMAKPRSDIGRLQARDIHFNFTTDNSESLTGVTIHFREPKETQVKTSRLGVIEDSQLCPVTTLFLFLNKTQHLRTTLPSDHTLFLAYIENPEKISSIQPSTLSKWVKDIMKLSDNTTKYKAHSVRPASSTKAVERGHSIQAVKEHANWSLNTNTFEKFYYKPTTQTSSSSAITNSIFLQENTITLEVGMEPTEIDLGTTNNQNVGEMETNNVIDTHPWYRRLFGP
jgi:hypothetical protein